MKKLRKSLIFDGTTKLKLEMTSYSDNAYDVTNCFHCFEKFLAFTLFLSSFIVVRRQMAELKLRGFLPPPPSIIGVSQTPSKVGFSCLN